MTTMKLMIQSFKWPIHTIKFVGFFADNMFLCELLFNQLTKMLMVVYHLYVIALLILLIWCKINLIMPLRRILKWVFVLDVLMQNILVFTYSYTQSSLSSWFLSYFSTEKKTGVFSYLKKLSSFVVELC